MFGIDQVPRRLPSWEHIVTDLGNPGAPRIGQALGVGKSTVYRWEAEDSAPLMARLALFWLTRWGRSQIHTQAVNDAMQAVGMAKALADERLQLLATINRLKQEREQVDAWLQPAMQALSALPKPESDQFETKWKVLLEPSLAPVTVDVFDQAPPPMARKAPRSRR